MRGMIVDIDGIADFVAIMNKGRNQVFVDVQLSVDTLFVIPETPYPFIIRCVVAKDSWRDAGFGTQPIPATYDMT